MKNPTKWYFGLMRFSPNDVRMRTPSPMYATVQTVNEKLKVIGDALYPEVSMGEHRPLTWDANYDNFSSTNGLSATTLVDAVWPSGSLLSTAAGKLEFGQFHNGEADYVLVVNRLTKTSQTLDLRFDVAQMASNDAGSGAFQVEDVSVVSVVNGTPSTLVADASGNVTVSGQTLAAGDARLYRIVRVDQPGMVSLSSTAPTVDHPVTATLSDPDFPVRDEVWQWQRRQPDGTWEPVRPGLLGSPSPSSPSYRPTVRDLDRPLRATVRYRDRLSSAEFVLPDKSAQSAATSPVEWGLDPVLTVAPLASGSVRFKVALPAPVESRSPEPEPGEDLLSLAEIDLEACTRTNGVRSCPWHRGDEIGQLVSGAPGSRGVSSGITFTATPVASVEEGPGAGSQLYNGQTYRFRARLLGPEGQPSAASDSVTVLGLRAEGRDGSVVLSWDTPPIAGVTAWAYRHRPADGSWEEGDWQPIPGSGEATTTASVEGLSNGVAHWFQVRAVLAMGSGPESFVVSATPDTPGRVTVRPTQPRVGETLKATLVDPDTPVEVTGWRWRRLASWDRSADIDSASAPPSSERWTQVVGRTRKYKPVKADLGRRLRVEVDYTDRSGAQGARTTTPPVQAGPPCAPPDLAAAAGAEDGQVELTWAAACNHGSAIRQYQYQHLGASAWEPVSGDGSARRQVVDGLTAGQTYPFQVRARNGVGPGPPSQVTVALPDPDPPDDPPPPRPGTITLEPSIAQTCARLTATLRDADGGIDLEPSHSPTTEPTFTYGWVWDPRSFPSDGPASAATSVTQDHIPPNSSVGRFIEVTARYGDNRSDRNEVLVRSGTVVANTPRTPGRLAGAAGDGQVDLSWTAPNDCGSDITHYDYRVRPNPSGAWSAWQDTTATSVTVSPLTNDVEYTFEVRAHNGRGASRVAAITRRPLPNAPDPPDATLTLTNDDPPYSRTPMVANFSHPGSGTVTGWAWYRLTRADQEESSDNHITGQITNRYVPREADLNHWIRVIATYNDNHAQGRTVAATTAQAVQRGDDGGTITFTGIDPPLVNREITATLHDDDNPTNLAWQWDVVGAAGARPEGRIDEGNTYTPGSGHVGSRIRAQVIYDDDFGRNKIVRNTTPVVQASSTLTLREISKQDVRENTQRLVGVYESIDPQGRPVAWSLIGTDPTSFQLRDVSGHANRKELRFKTAPNYEGQSSYSVTVRVSAAGVTKTKTVPVTVLDGPDTGTITLAPTTTQTCARIVATLRDEDSGLHFNQSLAPAGFTYGWLWDPRYFPSDGGQAASVTTQDYIPPNSSVGQWIEVTVRYGDDQGDREEVLQRSSSRVLANTPRVPTLSGTAGVGQVALSWTKPGDCGSTLTGYDYKYKPVGGQWSALTPTTTRSETITGLTGGVDYLFEVRAHNARGASRVAAITRRPLSNRPPTVTCPSPVTVDERISGAGPTLAGPCTGTDPDGDRLTWSAGSGFRVSPTSGPSGGSTTVSFATEPDYETAQSHTVAVTATDPHGASGSDTITINVRNVDEPGTLTISPDPARVRERVTLTVTDPDDGVRGTNWAWWPVSSASRTTGDDARNSVSAEFYPNRTYANKKISARVTYTDNHGSGKDAEKTTTHAVRPNVPLAPPNFTASRGDGQVSLSWGAADDGGATIDRYEYQYRPQGGSYTTYATIDNSTITGLTNGTRYDFHLRAHNSQGDGAAASAFATPAGPPGAPGNFAHHRATSTSVDVSWEAPADNGGSTITEYQWSRRVIYDSWTGNSSTGTTRNFTDDDVVENNSYTYRVRAVNSVDGGPYASYTVPRLGPGGKDPEGAAKALASIAEPTELAILSAPNPFNQATTLYFHLPEAVPVTLTIYNVSGQPVAELIRGDFLQVGTHAREWVGLDDNGRPAASGLYLFRLIAGGEIRVGKIALIR